MILTHDNIKSSDDKKMIGMIVREKKRRILMSAKTKSKSVASRKVVQKIVIKGKPGQKAIVMKKGGLHQTTSTPADKKIPAAKMQKALAGKYGKLGKKQAVAATGLLRAGRATAAANRAKNKQK